MITVGHSLVTVIWARVFLLTWRRRNARLCLHWGQSLPEDDAMLEADPRASQVGTIPSSSLSLFALN